jgi:poly-gamma-glutamate synthesis protein (capsule biosynthesis protein)
MKVRSLFNWVAATIVIAAAGAQASDMSDSESVHTEASKNISRSMTIFLCGDVMTGRGIDQVLPHPSDPVIYEPYMKNARGYVEIAERANGPIEAPVDFSYIWGDALDVLDRVAPDVRIVNLETSVTRSDDYWKAKGINYRMHPENTPVLTAAKIDVCALANNHVLDWGYAGLRETLQALRDADLQTAGAGSDLAAARTPAVTPVPGKGRVVVVAFGHRSSGIPSAWGAADQKPGVVLLTDLSDQSVGDIGRRVAQVKRRGDVVVASVHWGSNWGYDIPREHVSFAHRLIETAGVDIVHGHSSHHVRAIEVYGEKLILYGCGDFLNDYEGIDGYEEFRGDLSLMYFATVDPAAGRLLKLEMTPTQVRRFQIVRASAADTRWLKNTLTREGAAFNTRAVETGDGRLRLQWE